MNRLFSFDYFCLDGILLTLFLFCQLFENFLLVVHFNLVVPFFNVTEHLFRLIEILEIELSRRLDNLHCQNQVVVLLAVDFHSERAL